LSLVFVTYVAVVQRPRLSGSLFVFSDVLLLCDDVSQSGDEAFCDGA